MSDPYRPILRPRRGELTALHHLDREAAGAILPIFELDRPGGEKSLVTLLRTVPPATPALSVDFGGTPDSADPLHSPSLDLAEALIDLGLPLLPVIRPHDTARRLAEHGLAARMHLGRAVLRMQPHADVTSPALADHATDRVLHGANLEPENLDLIIDLAETACQAHADTVEERARRVLRWARRLPWRSITVAAGAMPPNLDELPTDTPYPINRLDSQVWNRLAAEGVGYADYGVTSPVRRAGVHHHRQLPTLRYAAGADWWIYRWSRRGGRGDDRCHDLCRTLVRSAQWPAEGARYSWGDTQIARRARSAPGAGSPAGWTAWSTSHHLAHVLRSLAPAAR